MSKKNQIRPLAICVFRHQNRILVSENYDSHKEELFYRPLGGRIEFGESGAETICRELMEEIQVDVDPNSLRYLGAIENIFKYNGRPGHEIVLIYDGTFKEKRWYNQALIRGMEGGGAEIRAVWKNIQEFGNGKSVLYPTGLLELLA